MRDRLARLPLLIWLMALGAAAMLLPAGHALGLGDFRTARIFLYGAVLSGFLTGLIGLATTGPAPRSAPRAQLLTLLAAFGLLPLMFAIPFYEAAGRTTLLQAWFEMVSSFTTTGATLYDNAGRLNPTLHLWRALVGWMGGLLVWITAAAILAPLNLGGFEVRAQVAAGDGWHRVTHLHADGSPAGRLLRVTLVLAPLYAALTLGLWTLLVIAGEVPFVALCHAMGILSTSGISPVGGVQYATAGVTGEVVMALFLVFALSRLSFCMGLDRVGWRTLWRDPEWRLGVSIVVFATVMLILRPLLSGGGQGSAGPAIWGGFFTLLSFLTTTGYESELWLATKDWAGLPAPGLILLGLALIGGGVATTAGGVKLLRIHVLLQHGRRELERLVHPNSVGGGSGVSRQVRRQAAVMAWVFFMLFALSVLLVMLALSLTGLQFEPAMVLTISALTNTGPLAEVAGENPVAFAGIPDMAKVILAATMVLGRLETLALVALFNPGFWRS